MPKSTDLVTRVLEKLASGEVPATLSTVSRAASDPALLGDDPPWCESCPCIPCVPLPWPVPWVAGAAGSADVSADGAPGSAAV